MENKTDENSQSESSQSDNSQSDNALSEKRNSQSRADKLEERLIVFAVRIVRLSASLPRTTAGKHIAGQILRSGTSPAPNYGEARGAESHADFVHKVRIVLKELNETAIWLRIIERGGIVQPELLADIIQETKDLCRIFSASLKTARNAKSHLRSAANGK
jgi:four helix bundle protein